MAFEWLKKQFRREREEKEIDPPAHEGAHEYPALNSNFFIGEAVKLDWQPTRTVPGILLKNLDKDNERLLRTLEKRQIVRLTRFSESLGGAAFYAVEDPLKSSIEAKPGYAEAKEKITPGQEAKRAGEFKMIGSLAGWKSDYHGKYELIYKDNATKTYYHDEDTLDLLRKFAEAGIIERQLRATKDVSKRSFVTSTSGSSTRLNNT